MKNNISALSGFLQCAASPAPPSGAASAPPASTCSSSSSPAPPQPEQKLLSPSNILSIAAAPPMPLLPDLIQGSKMRININNCPSELRRFAASPYVVIQKYNKAYYLKKQYWAKIYEVEYSLIKNPLSAAPPSSAADEEHPISASFRKSFVAATGDEIGLFGEGATLEDAAIELQIRLSSSISQLLEEGQSHCLPSKRKHQDVLLKDFEEEMVSHGVKIMSPPKYVPIKITFDFAALKKPGAAPDAVAAADAASNGAGADSTAAAAAPPVVSAGDQQQPGAAASAPPHPSSTPAPASTQPQQEPPAPTQQQAALSVEAPTTAPANAGSEGPITNGDPAATPNPNPKPSPT